MTTPNDHLPAMRAADEPENPHSPVRRLIEASFRSKSVLIVFAFLGGTVGAAVGIMKPNEYGSVATFMFRDGSESVAVTPSADLPRDRRGVGGMTENAPHLLVSPELARRTVQRLGVDKIFQPFRPDTKDTSWLRRVIRDLQGSIHDGSDQRYGVSDAVNEFLSSLEVTPFRFGSMLGVQYTANDPRLAQDVLKVYCEEAVKFHIEIYNDQTTLKMVEANHEAAKTAFETAKASRKKLLEKTGMTDFEVQFEDLRARANNASQEFSRLQEDTIPSLELEILESEKSLSTMEPKVTQIDVVPVPNSRISLLNTQLVQAESDLLDAQWKFKDPKYPETVALTKRVADLKKRLLVEQGLPEQVNKIERLVDNGLYVTLKASIEASRRRLAVLKGNVPKMKLRAETLQGRVDGLTEASQQYRSLTLDLELARSRYNQTLVALSSANSKQRLAASQFGSLRPIEPPSFMPSRVGPKRGQMALFGLLAGLGLGFGLIAVRALSDKTVRTPEELEQLIGLRVLATVPDLRSKHVRRHENRILSGC